MNDSMKACIFVKRIELIVYIGKLVNSTNAVFKELRYTPIGILL